MPIWAITYLLSRFEHFEILYDLFDIKERWIGFWTVKTIFPKLSLSWSFVELVFWAWLTLTAILSNLESWDQYIIKYFLDKLWFPHFENVYTLNYVGYDFRSKQKWNRLNFFTPSSWDSQPKSLNFHMKLSNARWYDSKFDKIAVKVNHAQKV